MRNITPDNISEVFAAYAAAPQNQRARDIIVALARHLHDFVREVGLTHEEWRAGLDALTRAAAISDRQRNEFVLFSDMMGVSTLVDMINTPPGATSSSVLGPFHQSDAPELPNGGDLWKGQPGEVLVITGEVVDAATGAPVPHARLDLWQNADNGFYSAQDPAQPDKNYHGLLTADAAGEFCFSTTRFKPYTVPYDGPAGDMLRALGREAWRPAHLHVIVAAADYRPIVTELFLADDPWLDRDAAFGVREDIILALEPATSPHEIPAHLAVRDRLPPAFWRTHMRFRLAREA